MSKYTNRYGDKFTFEKLDNGNIQWNGDFSFVRTGWGKDDQHLTMVDPSGGPFLSEDTDMKQFGLDGKVKHFVYNDIGYEIVLK